MPPTTTSSERKTRQVEQADAGWRSGSLGMYLPSHPIRAVTEEARHLHQLERAGESESTPWIAIAGLILFYAALGLLVFGVVELASQLLASTSTAG